MEFSYMVFILSAVLLVFLIFKEVKRANKARLPWRLLASTLVVLGLMWLVVPFTYTVTKNEQTTALHLFTEGLSNAVADTVKGKTYSLDSALAKELSSSHIADLSYYLATHQEVKQIHVYGYGLSESALQKLNPYQVAFHPAQEPMGILSSNWERRIKQSAVLNVQGTYHNPTEKTVQLKMLGFGEVLDSLAISAHTTVPFAFKNQPKQLGKAVYHLVAVQGKDTISTEPVPFTVLATSPARVLILAASPDFEYKFLKEWLFDHQYPVAFRSMLSKDKYQTDFLNLKSFNLNQIGAQQLKNFDVLIVDEEELALMPSAERSAIYKAVNDGLGMIVRISGLKPLTNLRLSNRFEVETKAENKTILKLIAEELKLSSLPFAQRLFLKTTANSLAVVSDQQEKPVVTMEIYGLGKILTSALATTNQWVLAGQNTTYTQYWAALFDKALRKETAASTVQFHPAFPVIGNKTSLVLSISDQKVPRLKVDSTTVGIQQNLVFPFKWEGVFWPKQSGWRSLTINGVAEDFYAYRKQDWKAVQYHNQLRATQLFVSQQAKKDFKTKDVMVTQQVEVSKWWFFALFLLAATYLWYEQRFLNI